MIDTSGLSDRFVQSLFLKGNYADLGTSDKGSYYSTDGGRDWLVSDFYHFVNISINTFIQSDTNIFTGTSDGVFLSHDYGQTWSSWALNGVNVVSLAQSGNYLFAAAGEVYLTSDSGYDWMDMSNGLSGCTNLTICDSFIYAGNGDGAWRRPLSDFGITAVHENEITLQKQNQINILPNPFSGTTTISLNGFAGKLTSLKIYDALGRQVADLTAQLHGGVAQIAFDGHALEAGVYVCRAAGIKINASKVIFIEK